MAAQDFLSTYGFDLDNTIPERAPVAPEKVQPKVVQRKPKTRTQLKNEAKLTRKQAFRVLAITAVLLVMVGSLIYGRVKVVEITYERDDLKTQYNEEISENIRLESEVKRLYSVENITAYAEEELGMIKRDGYQTSYFSVD